MLNRTCGAGFRPCPGLVLLAVVSASLAFSQSAATKKTARAAPAAHASSSRTTASKTTGSKKGKSAKKAIAGPVRQAQPTPERYKEIQQALVDKGYLKSEPNGVWDADSSAAMAQFQNDHKLPPTGKLTSASLIGLGLGPSTAAAAAPVQAAADSTPHPAGAN